MNRSSLILVSVIFAIIFFAVTNGNLNAAFFTKDSADYYKEGLSHFKNKNYYLSSQSLLNALQLKPDYPDAKKLLGFSYIKTGRALDAEYIFLERYKQKNNDIEAFQGLGWTYYSLGKHADAENFFKKEIDWAENFINRIDYVFFSDEDKSIIESYYCDGNYGMALLSKDKKSNAAARHFELAMKYNSMFTDSSEILAAFGDLYYFQARYQDALPLYEKAVKSDKNNLAAQLKHAWAYYYLKNYSAAEKIFEQALEGAKKSESVEALYGMALSNYYQNKFDTAYSNFSKAIAVNPYYMDNIVLHGIIEKKPEWRKLWKDFGLAYKNIYVYNFAGSYYAALYKLDGYLRKVNAGDVEALIAEGWCNRGLGYLDKALESFNAALKLNAKADEAYVGIGSAYLAYNKPADALNAFNQALMINPQNAGAYNGLAYYHFARKDEIKTMEALQKSISINKNFYDSQAFIANLLLQQKKYDEAIKEYEKLIEIDKSVIASWNMSGWAYYAAGQYQKALKAFAESKKINPLLVEAHYGSGLSLAKAGDLDDAKDELETAINIYPYYAHTQELINLIAANPKWKNLYKTLGWSYYNNQSYKLAAAAFREYLAAASSDIEALRGMAWSNYWQGQVDASYAGFAAILKNKADDLDALVGIGWVLYLRDKDSEALNYLQKAVKIDDKNVSAWRAIAAVNFRAKKFTEANDIYRKIAAIQPLAVDAYNNQGWALYRENKFNEAISKFQESLRVSRQLGEPYYGLALSYVKLGDTDKAKENFATAMYLYPAYMDGQDLYAVLDGNSRLSELYNSLGWGYYYQYYYDKAKQHFNKVLKNDAGNHDALLGLGTIAYVLGDFDGAIALFNKVLPGISPTAASWDKNSYMLENLGWCYYYKKEYDKSLELFKRLENYHPGIDYIAPINGTGWCELMKGNKAEAQKLFQKSLKILPFNYSAETGMKALAN